MLLQRLSIILCILLLAFIPKCYAPPIQQDDSPFISKLPVVSILRIVFVSYIAHIVTIRPTTGISTFSTLERRIMGFLFPSSEIGIILGSMYKAYYGDEILKITKYKPFLERYDKEIEGEIFKVKNKNDQSLQASTITALPDSTTSASLDRTRTASMDGIKSTLLDGVKRVSFDSRSTSSDSFSLDGQSATESKNDEDYDTKYNETNNKFSSVVNLRNRLVKDTREENNLNHPQNAAYLAAFLHIMGPKRAKKIKHCILANSLILGSENNTGGAEDSNYIEGLTINGPGAACNYQYKINLNDTHFMTDDMINQLETAHYIDNIPYIEIFITIVQLFFTAIECMEIDGDRWVKLIMIIYTIMSVLQTVSLIALHKQTATFSVIKYDRFVIIKYDHYHNNVPPHKSFYDKLDVNVFCFLAGIISFLLLGIWADYNNHSVTEWLVISWIISPLALYFMFFLSTMDILGIIGMGILLITCFGLLISATIIGYLPK
ncbi:hypothetical protein J3Q64DRAFT_1743568 [Phycomyces blakesleeanus]|uniref:Uncharacterized protein n=1 Tax=Phycomyces blakesleeanus TaxID=4837 RepID=A0ABR3AZ14_PHYBL